MKHFKLLAAAILMLSASTVKADDYLEKMKAGPLEGLYIGVSFQAHCMDFKGNFGNNIAPNMNAYVGLKVAESLGIEGGYETANISTSILKSGHTAVVNNGHPGPRTITRFPGIFKSTAKLRGPYLEAVGFFAPYEESSIKLMGGFGISSIRGTFEHQILQLSGLNKYSGGNKLSQRKSVLRLVGGLQYMFDDHFGARATVRWVNTAKIATFANTTSYGFGVVWAF
jgi:hypothetical protein